MLCGIIDSPGLDEGASKLNLFMYKLFVWAKIVPKTLFPPPGGLCFF